MDSSSLYVGMIRLTFMDKISHLLTNHHTGLKGRFLLLSICYVYMYGDSYLMD